VSADRRARLAANLAAVRERIVRACAGAARSPAELTLIVVTKTFPASDVRLLAELGVTDVGENRDQEARAKISELAARPAPVRWHFVGRLQTNKCRSVAGYADLVHSADRREVVAALDRGAARAGRRLDTLVQLSLDRHPGRGGAPPAEVPALAGAVAEAAHLRLAGLMVVAPPDEDPHRAFAKAADVAAALRAAHPQATVFSAGMSGDLEAAVAAGATHLRVGTAVLGDRPPLVR
jgi:pyridoxal phosphate enzyme (YggS family)